MGGFVTDRQIACYGVREFSPAVDLLDRHAEELRLVGYTVLDSGLKPEEVANLSGRIKPIIEGQEREFGGAQAMARIGEANTARALLAYDEAFLALAANPQLMVLVAKMLGQNFVLSQQNSTVLEPLNSHHQTAFHRDLPYQHFTSSRPIAINALFCADEFTNENGATRVIPGSHKYEPFPSDDVIRQLVVTVTAPAGSFIVLDAMIYHGAGENRSPHARRGVNHVFVLPFMRQQVDLPKMLGGRYADDPNLSRLLGYDYRTPESVMDWRRSREAKLG
jgi:ectoine hydroxylase-related dioxygenase (phytanoyl-CoA dioxygenase family)